MTKRLSIETRQEVLRLRGTGMGYGTIAKTVGICKRSARTICDPAALIDEKSKYDPAKKKAQWDAWIEKNRERKRLWSREWAKENKVKRAKNENKRRYLKLASSSHLTEEENLQIELIYQQASNLREKTGIMYHVDHIVPLKGKNVCGLHKPCNLQIILGEDNMRKNNKFSGGVL